MIKNFNKVLNSNMTIQPGECPKCYKNRIKRRNYRYRLRNKKKNKIIKPQPEVIELIFD